MNTKAKLDEAVPNDIPEVQNSIVNLMGSILQGLGGRALSALPLMALSPAEVEDYRQVLLLVVDGLGMGSLKSLSPSGILARSVRAKMTSVFPSTTATAVTSLMTGLFPIEHGLTGWHMYLKELGTVLAVLPGKPRYGGVSWGPSGVDVKRLLGLVPIFDRIAVPSRLITPRKIADSPFNRALRGKGTVDPFGDLDDFFTRLERGIRDATGRQYHYAYWSDLDHISHESGSSGISAQQHLHAFETAFEAFLDRIAGTSTLILVTADHGFIDHDPEAVTNLWEYPEIESCLMLPLSGEARAAYAYVRSGRENPFERHVTEYLSERITLHRSEDLVTAGWFGSGEVHPRFRDRIGDYVLLPKGRGIVRDAVMGEKKNNMIGYHGGIHPDEMRVPLIVVAA